MKHLLLLTISPVQSFIEQARKTHDLKAGSKMLSDLIHFAIEQLPKGKGKELIFPAENIGSKPNRFIAIIDISEDMQTYGDGLKSKIQNHFLAEAERLFEKTGFYENCKEQLQDFFKIYWVAKKYDENKPYTEQHKRLEQLLGAVKAARPFKQLEEKGRKCSINGEMNVKFYRKTADETKNKKNVKGDSEKLFHSDVMAIGYNEYGKIERDELQAGEGLCAISFLKRKWPLGDEKSFPSVSEIALMNVLGRLRSLGDNKLTGAIKLIEEINDQFFYEENITEKEFERVLEEAGKKGVTDRNTMMALQGTVAKAAKEQSLQLSKYYAVLVFDADDMGKALQGKDKKYQTDLSGCLGAFAQKATAYIDGGSGDKTQKGKTVYAGGDDFLGFINLDYLFEAMQWLREQFDAAINQEMKTLGHPSPNLSFSAGLAIAHYKTPLSEVLRWARASEKEAKKKYKYANPPKNAFCLAVLKHSGEIHQSAWKWSYDGHSLVSTVKTLDTLLQKLISEEVSSKFIKNIASEFRKMTDEKGEIPLLHKEMLKFEFERLFLRAKSSDFNTQKAKELAGDIYNLFAKSDTLRIDDFVYLLEITDFLHRHVNQPLTYKTATA